MLLHFMFLLKHYYIQSELKIITKRNSFKIEFFFIKLTSILACSIKYYKLYSFQIESLFIKYILMSKSL